MTRHSVYFDKLEQRALAVQVRGPDQSPQILLSQNEQVVAAQLLVDEHAIYACKSVAPPRPEGEIEVKTLRPHPGVVVFDGLLDDSMMKAYAAGIQKIGYQHGVQTTPTGKSVDGKTQDVRYLGRMLAFNRENKKHDISKTGVLNRLAPLNQMWERIKQVAGDISLLRVYGSAQVFGMDPVTHTDEPAMMAHPAYEGDPYLTILIYTTRHNGHWEPMWGGETMFYDQAGEVVAAVRPQPGRVVMFDGTIVHRAGSLSRYCKVQREILTFKCAPAREDSRASVWDLIARITRPLENKESVRSESMRRAQQVAGTTQKGSEAALAYAIGQCLAGNQEKTYEQICGLLQLDHLERQVLTEEIWQKLRQAK